MKKVIYVLIVLVLFTACTRDIVLRKNEVLKASYNEKTLPKGVHEVPLYRIIYPFNLEEKQEFFKEFNVLLKKYYLKDKKINFLINESFYADLKSLETISLLEEEKIYDKAASTLSDTEMKFLLESYGDRIDKYEGSTQEYLNIQINYLLNYLGKVENFDKNKLYSEREKSELVDELKETRRENVQLLKDIDLQFVLELNNPYAQKTEELYWDNREFTLKNSSNFDKKLNNYTIPIYIKGIKDDDVKALVKEEYKINNKIVFIENNLYEGYKNLGSSYIFLIGGSSKIKSYEDYEFNVVVTDIELKNMINLKDNIVLTEILGGKK
ncbi:MAG: hypothetical protein KA277_03895 [Fusobacteriaceae bacterium]|jgi:hypothetical protein|nr:hypothetical protein [Fusobacteriaceae bacterium]MBP6467146.1 hypothetical protein [Fusobacteriaceae bacterium]MBP9596189.1 hypothetical protein [Fusobacteriaceae bacterium]MBU9917593.1 hypothetical protein [Fusobacteriaceae bacterium]